MDINTKINMNLDMNRAKRQYTTEERRGTEDKRGSERTAEDKRGQQRERETGRERDTCVDLHVHTYMCIYV